MHNDGYPAVIAYCQEHQRIVDGTMGHAVGAVLGGIGRLDSLQAVGDEQQAAHRLKLQQEFATTQSLRRGELVGDNGTHLVCPESLAACLMAARMRGYVPQRQIFPDMAASMSASLGSGLAWSNAAAEMICSEIG